MDLLILENIWIQKECSGANIGVNINYQVVLTIFKQFNKKIFKPQKLTLEDCLKPKYEDDNGGFRCYKEIEIHGSQLNDLQCFL